MLLRQMKLRSTTDVQLFAKQYKVAPGILVGRMQREKMIPCCGESSTHPYITSELAQGEPLRAGMGKLSLRQTLDIAAQIVMGSERLMRWKSRIAI
jgi:hypothetical protein